MPVLMSFSGLTKESFKEKKHPIYKSKPKLKKSSDDRKIICKLPLSLRGIPLIDKDKKPDNDATTQFQNILLDKSSIELKIVQKIRDEAHRFAITFNRDTRIKSSKKNILESLP
ncbi:MAG: hypothetical protein LBU14_06320 [Candidatus Peribacteria bacterium]|nr:hypothetical protein [Candidatus Peribacteria bacterium]